MAAYCAILFSQKFGFESSPNRANLVETALEVRLPKFDEGPAARPASSPRSIGRILGLFEAVARVPEGLSLAELGVALQSPKSSLLTILRPLVADGFLIHTSGRYQPGPKVFALATTILSSRKFTNILNVFLEELVARSGETAILATIDKEARLITYVLVFESPQSIRYTVPAGVTRPLYATSAGQVLLSYQPDEWQEKYLREVEFSPLTPATIVDPLLLRERLEKVRLEGIATSLGEGIQGSAGVAAAVFDSDSKAVGAILLAAPLDRAIPRAEEWKALVKEIAAKASAALGYSRA